MSKEILIFGASTLAMAAGGALLGHWGHGIEADGQADRAAYCLSRVPDGVITIDENLRNCLEAEHGTGRNVTEIGNIAVGKDSTTKVSDFIVEARKNSPTDSDDIANSIVPTIVLGGFGALGSSIYLRRRPRVNA